MAKGVNGLLGFCLADMLAMTLHESSKGGGLAGQANIRVDVGGVGIPFKQRVIDSRLGDTHFLMVKVTGNMVLLASARADERRGEVGQLTVVNMAQLKGKPEDFLSKAAPTTHEEAIDALGKAAVATFVYNGKWKPVGKVAAKEA